MAVNCTPSFEEIAFTDSLTALQAAVEGVADYAKR